MAYKYQISFQKLFVSGHMKGIKIWADYKISGSSHATECVTALNEKVKLGTLTKTIEGNKYKILQAYCLEI